MIEVSKERLDKLSEKLSLDRKFEQFLKFVKKAFIPFFAAEFALGLVLALRINIILFVLILAVADLILIIAALFVIAAVDSAAKCIKNSGSISDALKVLRSTKRAKPCCKLLIDEICSDRTLAETDRLIKSTDKRKYAYLSALVMKVSCLVLRCEFDEAEKIIAEIKTLPEKRPFQRNEHMVALLDYYSGTMNGQKYLDTISEYSDLLTDLPERCGTNSAIASYLSIAAHEAAFHQKYDIAVKYNDYTLEFQAKYRNPPNKHKSNLSIYNSAAIHLDKAANLLNMGNSDAAREELETAEQFAASLTCEIPPVFLKEWDEVYRKI